MRGKSAALIFTLVVSLAVSIGAVAAAAQAPRVGPYLGPYLGFDRNDYPGDAALPALRRTFRYTGYWLNNPPGEAQNTWAGKRAILRKNGFGFLVLFTGRTDAHLKGANAAALGTADGKAAAAAARREGFARNVLIFLDQEEGGRLLQEQAAYLFAWVDAVRAAGARPGVYCSGIPVPDGQSSISTAQDIAERVAARPQPSSKNRSAERRVALWVADDRCPPSPGCNMQAPMLSLAFTPTASRADAFTTVWQYAQSPRREQFSAACPRNQAPDGNCYAPGLPQGVNTFVDLDTANSPDPSELP